MRNVLLTKYNIKEVKIFFVIPKKAKEPKIQQFDKSKFTSFLTSGKKNKLNSQGMKLFMPRECEL